ncbi:MAG: sulfotransferase [Bacteroidales bacterium]|nr:sulfotransferase [Bacteroidales bacterium]
MNEKTFKLLMLSAMYENGGNTTHRFLDGHPELFVYPFESQPGTKYVQDKFTTMFPVKYRWPVFPESLSPEEMFYAIIDEEAKIRARTPYVSKFRNADFEMNDEERKEIFIKYIEDIGDKSRATAMEAFFRATFDAWKNYNRTGDEKVWVGYSPIIGVDGEALINDLKGNGYVLHVMRNPFSCYAETRKRPVPLSLDHYINAWVNNQYYANYLSKKFPDHFFFVRYEDIIENPKLVLGNVLKKIGLETNESLKNPSWNGEPLKEVYPWGTVRIPTKEVNIDTARELTKEQIEEIYLRTELYLQKFDYMGIYDQIK